MARRHKDGIMRRFSRFVLFLLVVLGLSACSHQEVIGGLGERQAADVISILAHSGISASREKDPAQGADRFRIMVNGRDFAQAVSLIRESIPPDDKSEILDKLTKPDRYSAITSEMNALKLDLGLATAVERQLLAYPGVVYVRANVSSKFGMGRTTPGGAAGASVVIRYLSTSGNVPFSETDIQQAVTKVVPGLEARDVALSISNVIPSKFQGNGELPPPPTGSGIQLNSIVLIAGVMAVLSLSLGGGVGYYFAKGREPKYQRAARTRKPTDKVRIGEG